MIKLSIHPRMSAIISPSISKFSRKSQPWRKPVKILGWSRVEVIPASIKFRKRSLATLLAVHYWSQGVSDPLGAFAKLWRRDIREKKRSERGGKRLEKTLCTQDNGDCFHLGAKWVSVSWKSLHQTEKIVCLLCRKLSMKSVLSILKGYRAALYLFSKTALNSEIAREAQEFKPLETMLRYFFEQRLWNW